MEGAKWFCGETTWYHININKTDIEKLEQTEIHRKILKYMESQCVFQYPAMLKIVLFSTLFWHCNLYVNRYERFKEICCASFPSVLWYPAMLKLTYFSTLCWHCNLHVNIYMEDAKKYIVQVLSVFQHPAMLIVLKGILRAFCVLQYLSICSVDFPCIFVSFYAYQYFYAPNKTHIDPIYSSRMKFFES